MTMYSKESLASRLGDSLRFYAKLLRLVRFNHRFKKLRPLNFRDVMKKLDSEELRYKYFEWVFLFLTPKRVQNHRLFFSKSARGFGEDAMHGMWWLLFKEFQPGRVLEIGVYRGQTISLWSMLAQIKKYSIEIWGVSPLSDAGDEVSKYPSINYEEDINSNHLQFSLPKPNLIKGFSTEPEVIKFVSENSWDIAYLDGSHDVNVVRKDVQSVATSLKIGGLLILDDASLYSMYTPPKHAFAGHPGPSTVAIELLESENFEEIGSCGHNRIYLRVR